MRVAQQGDRVRVHYVKRLANGTMASSRGRAPLEMTVGVDHPRLPGLGMALVGLAPGGRTRLTVPPEKAYGMRDPGRVFRLARTRFPEDQVLPIGKWVHILDRHGRRRLVRILEERPKLVVVDNNHPQAGQTLQLEIELVSIQTPDAGVAAREA